MTPLIVTADDYGLTDGTARAIIDLHHTGIVSATSVLVIAPGALSRLAWLDDAPSLAVGVHLAIVGEDPPLLTATEIPTLVDRRGRFASSWRALLPRLVARRVDPDDLRSEFAAQIDAVAEHRPVDHLDTHQHTHLWPTVGEVVVQLAVDRGAARVRVPRPTVRRGRGRALARLAEGLDRRVMAAGLARTDRFRGCDEAGAWSVGRLQTTIRTLAAGSGSVEINTHPGPVDDPERHRYAWGYHWPAEADALRSDAVRRQVQAAGFDLTGRLP